MIGLLAFTLTGYDQTVFSVGVLAKETQKAKTIKASVTNHTKAANSTTMMISLELKDAEREAEKTDN